MRRPQLNLYRTIILSVFPGMDQYKVMEKYKDEYIMFDMPILGEEILYDEDYIELLKSKYGTVDFIFIDSAEHTRRLVRSNFFKFYMVLPDRRIYNHYSKRVYNDGHEPMSIDEWNKRMKEILQRKGIASGYRIWRLGKKQTLDSIFYDIIRFDTNKFLESNSKFIYQN